MVNVNERSLKMNRKLYRIRLALSAPRLLPHIILFLLHGKNHLIRTDVIRWAEMHGLPKPETELGFVAVLIDLMTFLAEFRNVFYLRFGTPAQLFSFMCPALSTLTISCPSIGPAFYIQHGVSTLITARSIGANCWINQQVTIGYADDTEPPILGDNVRICAGAKVLGNLRIGHHATVGANSVVIGDVPPHATVMGVPARIIWKKEGVVPINLVSQSREARTSPR